MASTPRSSSALTAAWRRIGASTCAPYSSTRRRPAWDRPSPNRPAPNRSNTAPASPAMWEAPSAAISARGVGMSLERYQRIAAIGGVYSNHLALGAAVADARRRGVGGIFCQGGLGGVRPPPPEGLP